jgi:hypothetical protein
LLLVGLLLVTILCKSMGALALLVAGIGAMVATRSMRSKLPLAVLLAGPLGFVVVRLGMDWQAHDLIEWLAAYAPDRASSLRFRIDCEQAFMPGIQQRPWLGWSAWGLGPPSSDVASWRLVWPVMTSESSFPSDLARDSYWLITVMCFGIVGLGIYFSLYLLPILTLLRRLSLRDWLDHRAAGAVAVTLVLCLCAWDNIFNAMINPVYIVALGGLSAVAAACQPAQPPAHPVRMRNGLRPVRLVHPRP